VVDCDFLCAIFVLVDVVCLRWLFFVFVVCLDIGCFVRRVHNNNNNNNT